MICAWINITNKFHDYGVSALREHFDLAFLILYDHRHPLTIRAEFNNVK